MDPVPAPPVAAVPAVELRVRNAWRTTAKAKVVFLSIWYAGWLPLCAIAVIGLIADPRNWFLLLWMGFGIAGLIAIPHAFLQYWVTTVFEETGDAYVIRIESRFRTTRHVIPKPDFLGFAYREDADGPTSDLHACYRSDGQTRRIPILYWMKKEHKDAIIAELGWTTQAAS